VASGVSGSIFDFSQVAALAAELGKVPARALPEVDKVTKRGAQNLKDAYTAQAAGSEHFHGMAGSVSYDRMYGVGSVGYEIGPDKSRRAGALGNLFFFGGANGGGGTGDLDGPLAEEEPRYLSALGDVLRGLL
jgi:hypothetical protein